MIQYFLVVAKLIDTPEGWVWALTTTIHGESDGSLEAAKAEYLTQFGPNHIAHIIDISDDPHGVKYRQAGMKAEWHFDEHVRKLNECI